MKAWQKKDGQLALADVPEPSPRPDELVLRVEAVSLNRGEVRGAALAAEGTVPGWDVAGTVIAPAQFGASPAAGTRIVALLDSGGWAERAAVPVSRAAVIPEGVTTEVAATLPIAGLTVARTLELAEPLPAKRLLITGGSGGVGQLAIQLAALGGAEVTAVSSRPAQHAELQRLGAGAVVGAIEEARGPFDLVLESVGGSSLAKAIELVGREGVVVTIGNSSEQDTTFNARTLYAKGAAGIYGLVIFEEVASGRVGAEDLERLLALVRDRKLEAPISLHRNWRDLPATLAELDRRSFTGKAVLTVGP